MRPGLLLAFGLMLAPLLATGSAFAQGVQPLDRLLPQIRRSHPGQFFDADGPTTSADGSQHYHLKWMTPDGRILWLDADARTGRVLGTSPGRDAFDGRQGAPARVPDTPRNNQRYQGPNFFSRDGGGQNIPRGYGGQDNRANRPYDGNQGGNRFGGPFGNQDGNQGGGQNRGDDRSNGRGRAPNGR